MQCGMRGIRHLFLKPFFICKGVVTWDFCVSVKVSELLNKYLRIWMLMESSTGCSWTVVPGQSGTQTPSILWLCPSLRQHYGPLLSVSGWKNKTEDSVWEEFMNEDWESSYSTNMPTPSDMTTSISMTPPPPTPSWVTKSGCELKEEEAGGRWVISLYKWHHVVVLTCWSICTSVSSR